MNFGIFKSRKEKFLLPLILTLTIILISSCCYILFKFGVQCHWDEWTGRGLYPALAMAHGEDLYSLDSAPLVTSYGPGVALFYLPASLAAQPIQSITIAYCLNIFSMIFVFWMWWRSTKTNLISQNSTDYFLGISLFIFFVFVTSVETTTNYIFTIHADWPAFFFLLTSIVLFKVQVAKNNFTIGPGIAVLVALSFWTKITILPTILIFILIPLFERQYKTSFINLGYLFVSAFSIFVILGLLYDFEDIIFFTFRAAGSFPWCDRDSSLLLGNEHLIHNLPGKIVLLLKLLSLYAVEYWYFLFFSIFSLIHALQKKLIHELIFPISYILLLFPCLAALAKWGGIENSLLLCNALGLVLFIDFMLRFGSEKKLERVRRFYLLVLQVVLVLISITPLRIAKSVSLKIQDSPNNQAYQYLKKGHSDIYFAWYPISHYFAEKIIYSGLEVPTWIGLASPNKVKFDISHFPIGTELIALCNKTTYGRSAIERNIGKLIRIEDRKNLENWNLYKINEK